MNKNPMRLDAGESAFFARQIEHVKANTYDTKYKNLKATMLIPVSTEAPSGSETITYRSYSQVGLAKIIADYANDFPRVDVYGEEVTAKVRGIGTSYGYSIKEIRRAQIAGTPLEQRRANAARRANDEKVNRIAFNGDSVYGLQGLIDYPGITEATLTTGTSGNTWALKTPDEIIADVTALQTAIVETTNGREIPDTLIVPIAQYNILKNTRMTDGNDTTILSYILDNGIFETVEWVTELASAGDGDADRIMAYTRDPEHLTLEIPQAFEMFEPEKQGMEYTIACHSECGGVIVYYPLSIAYMDGV